VFIVQHTVSSELSAAVREAFGIVCPNKEVQSKGGTPIASDIRDAASVGL
jgi:hypothetical protein